MSQKSDKMIFNSILCSSTILVLLLIKTSQASSSQLNELQNELSEKMNIYHKLLVANDLYEQPEVDSARSELVGRQQNHRQQQQTPETRINGLINGNHATYVEPPADFKPIIYDFQKQFQQQQHQNGVADLFQVQSAQQSPVFSNQPADPLMLSSSGSDNYQSEPSQRQQSNQQRNTHFQNQARQQQQPELVQNLKPSIGRWNDWHDMSVEPDLAASDSQLEERQPQRVAPPVGLYSFALPPAPFRTRYRAGPSGGAIRAGTAQQSGAKGGRPLPAVRATLNQILTGNEKLSRGQPEFGQKMVDNELERSGANRAQQQQAGRALGSKGSKRRRKSKQSGEVRIQRLVAASQLSAFKQQQQQQVNGLASGEAKQSGQSDPDNQRPALVLDQPPPQNHSAGQQVRLASVVVAPSQLRSAGQDERVSATQSGANRLVIKRFGGIAQPQQPQAASSPAPASANSTQARRVVKRRRIKSQLPVGLSSWFLGGIRDLDGRHWQLPAEVISRLAVNDADFAGYSATSKQPPDESLGVVLISDKSGQQQAQKPGISQQIPR